VSKNELGGQVEGEHDLGELALGVGASVAVALPEHDVVEVDGTLGHGRHVDDPCRCALAQEREQLPGEEEAREVVDLEVELVAVVADPPGTLEPDPGVVD